MKLSHKIALGMAILTATGILVYLNRKRSCTDHMLTKIADEGYETANDVLFPGKNFQDKNLHYGPVVPDN